MLVVSGKLMRSMYLEKETICEERSACLLSCYKDFFFYLYYCNMRFKLLLKECCSFNMQSFFWGVQRLLVSSVSSPFSPTLIRGCSFELMSNCLVPWGSF